MSNSNGLHQSDFELIEDWFDQCDQLDSTDNSEQIDKIVHNQENLIRLIYKLLENIAYHEQYLEELCKHLFKLYLTKDDRLQVFVLSFIPTIIGLNLINSLNSKLKSTYQFVDVFLIGIYNFSLIDDDGQIKERSFRLPNLNKSSIYHFPAINNNMSEIAIRKLEQCYKENRILYVLDMVDQHYFNSTNRMVVYCNLIQIYHDSLSSLNKQALFAFARMCNSILFHNTKQSIKNLDLINDQNRPIDYEDILNRSKPNIQFSSNFLLQLLNCLYFCIYAGVEKEAKECVFEIHNKAKSLLLTDVLLMTNAIFNSLSICKESVENECMGINISFSPNSEIVTTTGQTKSAITNASFKTQKLPEDIEIITIKNEIHEETEEQMVNQSTVVQVTNKTGNKETINGHYVSSSKHQKESRETTKKDKKKKRTKSSNQDDVNLQILASNEPENRILFKINSQTKSNQHLSNDFLLESMKLINESNDRKSNQMNNSDTLNEEKIPLV